MRDVVLRNKPHLWTAEDKKDKQPNFVIELTDQEPCILDPVMPPSIVMLTTHTDLVNFELDYAL